MSITFRDYQLEAIESVFRYLEENKTGEPLIAMPGGSGKAIVIAGIILRIFHYWPTMRVLQLVHTKELVEQNAKKLTNTWPNAPVGIHCAGLNSKDVVQPIIFGSLGSARNNVKAFGHRDVLIVDEGHCISPEENTGYQKIIAELKEINPYLRIIGLTATKYRLGHGLLTNEGGLFTDVCFDITTVAHFNRLIYEGYLAPLIPKQTNTKLDISGVSITAGELNQGKLQKAVDKQEITYAALKEAVQVGYDRHCWKVFCSGVEHSQHAAEILQSLGISATFIHSKISDDERDERFFAFKTGQVQALCTYKIATTGFDHPPIDLIIDLYPTVSPVMHVQKYSRGTRPYNFTNPEQYIPNFEYIKRNTLVLDFAGNTKRIGPINDPIIPKKKGDKEGEAPIKICEAVHDGETCGIYNHASARFCGGKPYPSDEGCGAEFIFKPKIFETAGTDIIIKGENATFETAKIDRVIYTSHKKHGYSKPIMKATYYSGLRKYNEFIGLESSGIVLTKAQNWWRERHASEPPATVEEALMFHSQLRMPQSIRIRTDQAFPEIVQCEW